MGTRAWICAAMVAFLACTEAKPPAPPPLSRLSTDQNRLRDAQGRYLTFHGVNVGGSSKLPAKIDAQGIPSYVGRPFALEDAHEHFARLRDAGFDSVRLVVLWEGVEPRVRGEYDQAYLDYLRQLVIIAGEYRLQVLIDMHQDMFSRHLSVRFNNHPRGAAGSIESMLFAFMPPYNDVIAGDGAPRWAVAACLQEKNFDSPNWGTPRILSGLDEKALYDIVNLIIKLTSGGPPAAAGSVGWIVDFLNQKPAPFPPNETTDLLPLTNGSGALSMDVARAYACMFAGDKVFPGLTAEGQNVKDYLQISYGRAFARVAARVADLPNVMGYDLMNEPSSNFLVLAAYGAMAKGGLDGVKSFLGAILGPDTGDSVFQVLVAFRLIPADITLPTLKAWGLDTLDPEVALSLSNGFEDNYLRPFYERIGKEILKYDPRAVFFIETSLGLNSFLGGPAGGLAGTFEVPMTRPDLPQVVFAPHYYSDIYPFVGLNQPPRQFSASEIRYRDFQPAIEKAQALGTYSLGNPPVMFGEFGTFFSFNGIYEARQEEYLTSSCMLDDYYEAFERMNMGQMLWCYSSQNTWAKGDGWNHEDFSILDQETNWRGEYAWARPHARALAGKPIETHFWSDLHYFDPDKGVQPPLHEFLVRYQSKETSAPSEIIVPELQYPDGFYVWVSDGHCFFDSTTRTLFHYPTNDAPGAEHSVRILPPLPGSTNVGWKYFFKGDRVIERD